MKGVLEHTHPRWSRAGVISTQAAWPQSRSKVLSSADLLLRIMSFGGEYGHEKGAMVELGKMALACLAWRGAAQHESLWERYVKARIPRLAATTPADLSVSDWEPNHAELAGSLGSCRRWFCQYASMMCTSV